MDYTTGIGLPLMLLSSLAFPALIAFIIYAVVKKSQPNHSNSKPNHSNNKPIHSMVRNIIVSLVLLSATISGLISLTNLPAKILMVKSEAVNFGFQVAFGAALIIAGALLKSKLPKNFLLVLGLFMIIIQTPYVFSSFGSYGALAVVFIAFVALVAGTVILTKRHQHE